ncbi:MAG: hypothetical protein EXX96DRAFT_128613 [Benjaminiella poitrasii]|nr:MAG: hypothetical protein EXX96DRAFT_128613 [Benjaminiella poitrasii]
MSAVTDPLEKKKKSTKSSKSKKSSKRSDDSLDSLGEPVKSKTKKVKSSAKKAKDQLPVEEPSVVKDTEDSATDKVADVADQAQDTAGNQTQNATEKAQDVTNEASNQVQSTADKAQDVTDEAKDTIEDKSQDATNKTQDITRQVLDTAKDIQNKAEDAPEEAMDMFDDLQSRIKAYTEKLQNNMTDDNNNPLDGPDDALTTMNAIMEYNRRLMDRLNNLEQHNELDKDDVQNTVQDTYNEVKSEFGQNENSKSIHESFELPIGDMMKGYGSYSSEPLPEKEAHPKKRDKDEESTLHDDDDGASKIRIGNGDKDDIVVKVEATKTGITFCIHIPRN